MVLWIMFGASIFVGFFILQGGREFITDGILGTGLNPYGILLLMMVMLIFPRHVPRLGGHPAAHRAHFRADHRIHGLRRHSGRPGRGRPRRDSCGSGVLYLVNMQMSFLSPPFGYALFYLRGRQPARNHHGDHLQGGVNLPDPASRRAVPVRTVSVDRHPGCRTSFYGN